jgi:cellulose synthase/poly-beta-1,6-N-acetylglucosamine synthase-like glycosyltransferase
VGTIRVSYILIFFACLFALPVAVLFIETFAALIFPTKSSPLPINGERRCVAVIVPAHNESTGILPTIKTIREQLVAGDRLIVVADNCSDDTASVASSAGADTIERNEPTKIGKGYALDRALRHLAVDPPVVVICIDADCIISEGAIDQLARTCQATRRPVQALDLMIAPAGSPINYRVAEFAWRLKNWIRPLGLRALGFPCQLMGTGMAFTWDVIRPVSLASGALAEDMKLGLELAQMGSPPLFYPFASVTSEFPQSTEGAKHQRNRWEEGHIRLLISSAPQLIYRSILGRNAGLLVLALDLIVPPLTLLVMLVTIVCAASGVAAVLGVSETPLYVSAVSLFVLALAVFLSWLSYGRDLLPLHSIPSIASYIFAKLPLYRQIFSRRVMSTWVRADRSDKNSSQP